MTGSAWQASRCLILAVLLMRFAGAATPGTVLLIVNDQSPASRSIGEYYARKRSIPPSNVCRVHTSVEETITREVYRREIVGPVSSCLRNRKLAESVLYLVTTLGVPLRVDGPRGREGENASVDSELTLLYSDRKGKEHPLAGPLPNPFFQAAAPFRHPDFPMYLVTRLTGQDVADVQSLIDRSTQAQNRGKFVLDLSMANSTGDDWLRQAAARLPAGRVVLERTPNVLYGETDVIGYASWGSNDKQRKRRFTGFQWLPGAIMTEFVSTNARTFQRPPETWNLTTWQDRDHWFAGSPQTLTGDYIHEGVTGASGHVDEPYLTYTVRPDYLLPAYFAGRNLAESYYLATPALSWQNIVVGDPLTQLLPCDATNKH